MKYFELRIAFSYLLSFYIFLRRPSRISPARFGLFAGGLAVASELSSGGKGIGQPTDSQWMVDGGGGI